MSTLLLCELHSLLMIWILLRVNITNKEQCYITEKEKAYNLSSRESFYNKLILFPIKNYASTFQTVILLMVNDPIVYLNTQ